MAKEICLTATRFTAKDRAEMLQFMKTEQVDTVRVRVHHAGEDGEDGTDEEIVLEIERKDAEGRTLLQD